uniref:Apple domain-containing protein n=1 Tax=Daphnia galeata TaxID=27404 RepID=A0A8J2RRS0_9CRUS|nr:unnamed protein product [Daphnia galeata]
MQPTNSMLIDEGFIDCSVDCGRVIDENGVRSHDIGTFPASSEQCGGICIANNQCTHYTLIQRFTFVLVLLCIISCYSVMTDCSCDYHSGGCSIRRPASPGNACKCSYKGFWSCAGSQTGCRDPSSHYCHNPDTSIQSCFLGGGDCGGY